MFHRRFQPLDYRAAALRTALLAALAIVFILGAANALCAEERVTKYFVDVKVPTLEKARELSLLGFDIAGVDREELTVGVVVTSGELQRLEALGYPVFIRQSNDPGETITALSDYTDPVEMSAFMDQIVAAYPTLARKITIGGPLFEGQRIYAVQLTKDVSLPNDRPSFLFDAQHHAREVMTPEIARDMIDFLTSRYATDPAVRRWVDNVNIYVVGSVNPDGAWYVFHSDNMWRKNRHPSCAVDVNRNYPFLWGSCNGSSGLCSDETMRGAAAGSEPETQGMVALISDVRPFFSLSYHSYGEYIMYSYGCSNPDEMSALDDLGRALNAQLENDSGLTGHYATGPIWSTIYLVDGGSIDTSYGQYGTYGYTIEVNSSTQGFQPDYATWRNITVQRQRVAWQFFLDKTLDTPQIRGRVTDAGTGDPLPAQVAVQEVVFTHGEAARHADSRGLYRWLARAGQSYHVTWSHPGYCSVTQTVAVGTGPATVDVLLGQPAVPQGVGAQANGANRIDVIWDPAANADEYHVLRSMVSGGPYEQVAIVGAPQTSFPDTGVSGGTTYFYVVYSVQGCDSGNSTEVQATATGACTIGPAFAGIGSVTNGAISTCTLNLAWPAAAARCGGQVTYAVHRSTTSPFTPSTANLIASGLTGTGYADHGVLGYGGTYYYMVSAVDSANGSWDGNTVVRSGSPTGPVNAGGWFDDAGDLGTAKLTLTPPWTVLPTGGKTSPRVYATGNYPANTCAPITTPAITLQASGSSLTFASKYDVETGLDAGIVEVATAPNFGTWTRLTTVNYPDSLTGTGNACGFPTSGTATVFSRTIASPTYPASIYSASLAAYSGQQIKLRWRISSNGSTAGAGWWVDDITVSKVLIPSACLSGVVPNPKEVSGTVAMTALPTSAGDGIDLEYQPGCGTTDNAVYWGTGPIAGSLAWAGASCALGNTGRGSFVPPVPAPGSFLYFVLVGQNATKEGSYGRSSNGVSGTERPEATSIGSCDKPQDLTGSCP